MGVVSDKAERSARRRVEKVAMIERLLNVEIGRSHGPAMLADPSQPDPSHDGCSWCGRVPKLGAELGSRSHCLRCRDLLITIAEAKTYPAERNLPPLVHTQFGHLRWKTGGERRVRVEAGLAWKKLVDAHGDTRRADEAAARRKQAFDKRKSGGVKAGRYRLRSRVASAAGRSRASQEDLSKLKEAHDVAMGNVAENHAH